MILNPTNRKEIALLNDFLSCQKIDPYNGWDLEKLNQVEIDIEAQYYTPEQIWKDPPILFLNDVLKCRPTSTSWSITHLGKLADQIRVHYGLPTVEDLNPEIKAQRESLRRNRDQIFGNRFK